MKLIVVAIVGSTLATACARRPATVADAAPVPPECSPMHGGVAGTPARPLAWRRGGPVAARNADSADIVVEVRSARDGAPVERAVITFDAGRHARLADAHGFATATVRIGRVPIMTRALMYAPYADTIVVRGGFADTLLLSLGNPTICFM